MSDEPPYILDIEGLQEPDDAAAPAEAASGRRWIGIQFECCGVYTRIYRNRAGTAYEGNCPRCGRAVRARIGSGGTNQRLFRAQ
ncbi:MAG: hypothetical protein AMXMBFR13_34790 [Phycisphaerae bacterium]